ncbi:unnamed protein product [Amoebophrya sp. A25]|nr:unnamed protein product [Amoebophrya sp. A25]|eukprot:GSA25T00016726001.1
MWLEIILIVYGLVWCIQRAMTKMEIIRSMFHLYKDRQDEVYCSPQVDSAQLQDTVANLSNHVLEMRQQLKSAQHTIEILQARISAVAAATVPPVDLEDLHPLTEGTPSTDESLLLSEEDWEKTPLKEDNLPAQQGHSTKVVTLPLRPQKVLPKRPQVQSEHVQQKRAREALIKLEFPVKTLSVPFAARHALQLHDHWQPNGYGHNEDSIRIQCRHNNPLRKQNITAQTVAQLIRNGFAFHVRFYAPLKVESDRYGMLERDINECFQLKLLRWVPIDDPHYNVLREAAKI